MFLIENSAWMQEFVNINLKIWCFFLRLLVLTTPLSTANLPECGAAGYGGWSVWRAQVLRRPLWPVLWPRGGGAASDEDQQLPVLLKSQNPPNNQSFNQSVSQSADQSLIGRHQESGIFNGSSTAQTVAERVAFTAIFCPVVSARQLQRACDLLLCRPWLEIATSSCRHERRK